MPDESKEPSISAKIDAAIPLAAASVLRKARETDTPIVIWEDGQVLQIPVDEYEARMAARSKTE